MIEIELLGAENKNKKETEEKQLRKQLKSIVFGCMSCNNEKKDKFWQK